MGSDWKIWERMERGGEGKEGRIMCCRALQCLGNERFGRSEGWERLGKDAQTGMSEGSQEGMDATGRQSMANDGKAGASNERKCKGQGIGTRGPQWEAIRRYGKGWDGVARERRGG